MYKKLLCLLFISRVYFNVNSVNVTELVDYAVKQYTTLAKTLETGKEYPTFGWPTSDKWNTSVITRVSFDSGHYAGVLWHLYNYTKNEEWKALAIAATDAEVALQNNTSTHDIGFMIESSYGNGYAFTRNQSYPKIIANAAHSLATRFNPLIGCTRSWNSRNNGTFIVIADNMMNLELMFEAWKLTGNETLYQIAVSHTNKTIEEHLRSDYSHYQVVDYNETDGTVQGKHTADGYSDESCWSQSQGWLISGFTTAYRYTKMDHILKAAEGVSNYYIDNAPEDGVAYWDFNVPHDQTHQYIPRDSSAASITASGLFELYKYTANIKYFNYANKIIESLFSDKYRATGKPEYRIPALIVNGTWKHSDVALIFGDYYFIKSFQYYL